MKRAVVIMAGGSGERFWPLSRIKKPKQLLKLTSLEKTMIEEAIDRIEPLIPKEDIFIFTSEILQEPIRAALPNFLPQNVVAEPSKWNTAPCLAMAAAFLAERYENFSLEEISMAVLTADHLIKDEEIFRKTVNVALNYAENNPSLVTIGIQPTRPETGYGYIEVEGKFESANEIEVHPALRFLEKPDLETAGQFLLAGNFLWNSGMFFWSLDTFAEALQQNLPEVGRNFSAMRGAFHGKTNDIIHGGIPGIAPIYNEFPDISIDYGLMEKAKNVAVVRALFIWDDVGSWDALARTQELQNGNITSGTSVLIDTKNSIIVNGATEKEMIISVIGMDDVVVVATDDAVLVCPKSRVQDVKKSVAEIKKNYSEKNWL